MLSRSRSSKASTICSAVQAAVGCSVTLKCSTWRRRCSSTMNTNNTFKVSVGTVKKLIDHLTQVIVKKGLPRLTGWLGKPAQNARDGALGDGDAQHLQFAMNPWRTPQWIGHHHSRDQLANLQGRSGPASSPAMRVAQSGPKPAKPFALA